MNQVEYFVKDSNGANIISLSDDGNYYTGNNVEDALRDTAVEQEKITYNYDQKNKLYEKALTKLNAAMLDDFEDISAWYVFNSYDSFKPGISKVIMTAHPENVNSSIQKNVNLDLTGIKTFALSVNSRKIQKLTVYFSSHPYYSVTLRKDFIDIPDGNNTLIWHINDMTNNGQELSNITRMMLRINCYSNYDATAEIDYLAVNFKAKPRVLVMFDDCDLTSYTKGYTYMYSKGIKGTMYCHPDVIGTSGYMDLVQLNETYTNGWDIGNHTYNHLQLDTLTFNEIEQQIKVCTDWLNTCGYTRASKHLAYPFGCANDLVYSVMKKLKMKTGRLVARSNPIYLYPPMDCARILSTVELKNTTTLDSIKSAIDYAMVTGVTVIIFGHKIADNPASEYFVSTEVFHGMVDYIVEKKIAYATISEWYDNLFE